MKKIIPPFFVLLIWSYSWKIVAQESKIRWSVNCDFFSRYVWRGSDYGNSPVVQPSIKYILGGLTAGAWGNYSLSSNTGATEADLFLGYSFKRGFSLLVTDYYFPFEPGTYGKYFNYNSAHIFELTASQAIKNLNLNGNWFLANAKNDVYVEAVYAFKSVNFFAAAGNKSYTKQGQFKVVNLGILSTKNIVFTDTFCLPLTVKLILNPDKEQIFIVVGFSI